MTADNPANSEGLAPAVETAASDSPAGPEIETLKAELAAAHALAAENLDKFLRAKAESENVRRRAETEQAQTHKFAIERFALEMLAVKDSLERARHVDTQAGGAVLEQTLEGVDLTLKLMDSIFQKFTLAEVSPAKGDKFDPALHQAMSVLESVEVPAQHVLAPLQKGYTLHGRLLRPALVVVAKTPEAAGAPGKTDTAEGQQ